MKRRMSCQQVTFAMLVIVVGSVGPVQAGLFNCSSPTSCEYNGLPVTALGNAQLAIDAQSRLIVSGIGSSGNDGLVIDLGELNAVSDRYCGETELDVGMMPDGTTGVLTLMGEVDALPNQPIFQVTASINSGTMSVAADFSSVGAATYRVELTLADTVVATASGISSGATGVQFAAQATCKKKCKGGS